MLSSIMNSVKNYLAAHHMYAVDDWLSGFLDYLSEDTERNYSESEIQNLAKEQWMLNDLKEISPGSLPANLKHQQRTVLQGKFALQVNAAIDIGTPAYQQYQKLQKVNLENVEATTNYEDRISSRRMMKLCLTDGVQEICAIEYKPMRNLTCDITPGLKVLLKGPIECRRGVLLLTEDKIDLLGGEVQEIAITNSLAGQLSAKLGLAISPEAAFSSLNTTRNTNIPTPHDEMPPAYNPAREQIAQQTFGQHLPTNQLPAYNPPQTFGKHPPTNFQSDTFDDDIDVDQLAALEAQIVEAPVKRPSNTDTRNPEKKLKTEIVNQPDDYPDEHDISFEDEEYLREIEAQIDANDFQPNVHTNRGPISVPAAPFVYIRQIKEKSESQKVGKVFKVKGQVMTLLSKLSVGKDSWSLKCTIVDGTGNLDVEFTSDVLSKLVGYTPQEMNALKKQMAEKPELKLKAISALQKAKDSLQVLYCIIELTILEVPKITDLIPFDASHIDQLNRRAI
ncbi:unnamed protein product [Chrysodeixis includens]|uniref:RecQ-mediated genome instability protein 1 n=1 Tax=Chrysodeixis includens TaxID=689277 RepID=A0A9P0BK75_CHRIL|nr:unnamed protein product [Chrysodeixis includens]